MNNSYWILLTTNIAFVIAYLLAKLHAKQATTKQQKIVNKLEELQRNMNLALEVGEVETWSYNCQEEIFSVIEGRPLAIDCENGTPLKCFLKHLHPDDNTEALKMLTQLIEQREQHTSCTFRFHTPHGWRWLKNSCIPVTQQGNVVSIMGVRRDVTAQIEAENQLKEQLHQVTEYNENLLEILDYLPIPIALRHLESGRYTYINKVAAQVYGICVNQPAPYKVISSTLTGDLSSVSQLGIYEAYESVLLPSGQQLETQVKSIAIRYQGGTHALIARVDLTDYNQAKKDSVLLTTFMPALRAYSWYYDTHSQLLTIQHSMQLERKLEGHISRFQFNNYIHPDDRQMVQNRIDNQLREGVGQTLSFQYRMDIEKVGQYEWWETHHTIEETIIKGEKHRLITGISINVHKRVEAELALKHRNNDVELILNNANSLLAYVTPQLEVIWSNSSTALGGRLEQMYRAGTKCCMGRGCLLRGDEGICPDCPTSESLRTGKLCEREFQVAPGIWFKTTAIPILNQEEADGSLILRIDDVSEYKRLIQELEVTTAKAEESDQLKSAFLANMSHEIRTPLNAIVGFSGLLQEAETPEERESYLQIINTNNELLLRLIGDILDLAKIESGIVKLSPTTFDLHQLFVESYQYQQLQHPNSKVLLQLDIPAATHSITLDRTRVQQIVTNYLNNAFKFTHEGTITLGYKIEPKGVLLFVKDSGIGVSPEKQSLIFERFQKLNDDAQGTGLGLPICKAIALRMGGHVWMESEVGVGSSFYAWLPCC